MSGHTPGPWDVRSRPWGEYVVFCRAAGSDDEAFYNGLHISHCNGEQAEANARLIAAAPDLLEALREIAKGEGRYSRDPLEHASNTIDDMKALALAAIAKATGEGQ